MQVVLFLGCLTLAASAPVHSDVTEKKVQFGKNVTLQCHSVDDDHNFLLWELPKGDVIVPEKLYDNIKYEYEVLTGKLTIKDVTDNEKGIYSCFASGVRNNDVNVRRIRMLVEKDWEDEWEENEKANYFRVMVVLGSLFVIFGGGFIIYKHFTDKHRLPRYLEQSDEEDSAEEVFSAPMTSRDNNETSRLMQPSTSKANIEIELK